MYRYGVCSDDLQRKGDHPAGELEMINRRWWLILEARLEYMRGGRYDRIFTTMAGYLCPIAKSLFTMDDNILIPQ